MSSIPETIWMEILIRVPVKTTFVCKCVCKFMRDFTSETCFTRKHVDHAIQKNNLKFLHFTLERTELRKYKFSVLDTIFSTTMPKYAVLSDVPYKYLDFHIFLLGSSKGLVCLLYRKKTAEFFICLWNPATAEYVKLPELEALKECSHFDIRINNFGYDSKTENFKVVIAASVRGNCYRSSFHIFGLREMSWITHTIPYYIHHSRGEVFLNGAFHWVCDKRGHASQFMLSWDVNKEVFQELQLPNITWGPGCVLKDIGVMDLRLCAVVHVPMIHVEVWVMQDYGCGESWSRCYVITHETIVNHPRFRGWSPVYSYPLKMAGFFESGEILFWMHSEGILYDPKHERVRKIHQCSLTRGLSYYLETFISLGSDTYVGRRGESLKLNQNKRKISSM